jgi:hypothetical protein
MTENRDSAKEIGTGVAVGITIGVAVGLYTDN